MPLNFKITVIMKKLFAVLAVLVPLISFSSCEKDKNPSGNGAPMSEKIVGSWQLTKAAVMAGEDGMEFDIAEMTGMSLVFEFKADGTGIISTSADGQYEESGFSWTLSGETLTVIEDGEPMECTVQTLTETELVFSFPIPDDTMTGTVTCVFARI